MEETLLERCGRIGTSTWSDALDDLGIDGVVRGIQQRTGQGRFAAFAVTARGATGPFGTYTIGDFAVAQMLGAVDGGEVLMVDMGGAEVSTFGGMAALAATTRRLAAVVIDGGCRDIEDIRSTGLWLASRAVTPTSGKRRVRLHSIGDPAIVGGITVHSGDAVIGDATGIVVVPRAAIHDALSRAEALHALDGKIETAIKDGKTLDEAVKLTGYV
ncbi:RraA family protein [Taklimakanibacter deserti]|uniref:RraA family protein n=1 Tax=Taklimakanibacter deserti TaxID=2267839 RepID=UPI0034D4CFC4